MKDFRGELWEEKKEGRKRLVTGGRAFRKRD